MSVILLYLLLLKATLTSFSGPSSLPAVRNDLVVQRRVLTDRQLNTAVAVGRMGPGANGVYVVSVGYFVAGVPGAIAGYLAMVTPAFTILLLVRLLRGRTESPRLLSVVRCILLAAAGLIAASTIPLARDAIPGIFPLAVAAGGCAVLLATEIDTAWVILGAAALGLLRAVNY